MVPKLFVTGIAESGILPPELESHFSKFGTIDSYEIFDNNKYAKTIS